DGVQHVLALRDQNIDLPQLRDDLFRLVSLPCHCSPPGCQSSSRTTSWGWIICWSECAVGLSTPRSRHVDSRHGWTPILRLDIPQRAARRIAACRERSDGSEGLVKTPAPIVTGAEVPIVGPASRYAKRERADVE